MMKHFVFSCMILFLLCMHTTVRAINTGDMLVTIPDSIMPYVQHEQVTDLINMKRIDPMTPACLTTMLKGEISLDTLSDDYLVIRMEQVTIEMARLKAIDDSIFCLLYTMPAPEHTSCARLYDRNWNQIAFIDFCDSCLLAVSDTLDDNEYADLNKLIEFPVIEAHFNREDVSTVFLNQESVMLNSEEKNKLHPLLMQRTLKWDGKKFK